MVWKSNISMSSLEEISSPKVTENKENQANDHLKTSVIDARSSNNYLQADDDDDVIEV